VTFSFGGFPTKIFLFVPHAVTKTITVEEYSLGNLSLCLHFTSYFLAFKPKYYYQHFILK
jgi:hypothetical protein